MGQSAFWRRTFLPGSGWANEAGSSPIQAEEDLGQNDAKGALKVCPGGPGA